MEFQKQGLWTFLHVLARGEGGGAGGSERSSSESFAYPINKAQSLIEAYRSRKINLIPLTFSWTHSFLPSFSLQCYVCYVVPPLYWGHISNFWNTLDKFNPCDTAGNTHLVEQARSVVRSGSWTKSNKFLLWLNCSTDSALVSEGEQVSLWNNAAPVCWNNRFCIPVD